MSDDVDNLEFQHIDVDKDSYDEVFSKFNDNFDTISARLDMMYADQINEQVTVKNDLQTMFTLSKGTYTPNTNSIQIYVNGVRNFNFVETSSSVVQFNLPISKGSVVTFIYDSYDVKNAGTIDKILDDYETFLKDSTDVKELIQSMSDNYDTDYKDAINQYISSLETLEETYAPKLNHLESLIIDDTDLDTLANQIRTITTLKADKTYVDNLFTSLTTGVPYGKFAKLDDLKAKYPTGDTHSYLVDKDIYYYDNISKGWSDAGLYVGTSLPADSVTLSQRTPLGNQALLVGMYGPAHFSSTSHSIINLNHCKVIYGGKEYSIADQDINVTDYTSTVISFNLKTSVLNIHSITGTSDQISDDEVVLGYIDWGQKISFIQGDYIIDGKLPYTETKYSDYKAGQFSLSDDDKVALSDNGTTINIVIPDAEVATKSDYLTEIPTQSINFTYTENSPSFIYIDPTTKLYYYDNVLTSNISSATELIHLFTYYKGKIYQVPDTSIFTVNSNLNGGWKVKATTLYDKDTTYVSGSINIVINSNGDTTITMLDDLVILSNAEKITVPKHTVEFTLGNANEAFWIYADTNNQNVLLYKGELGGGNIQAESEPLLLFKVLNKKVYTDNDSTFRNSITVNGLPDGGWNNPDPLSTLQLADPNGNLSITFNEDNTYEVKLSSTNQNNEQLATVNGQALTLPYIDQTFSTNDKDSYKILGYDSRNLKLVVYDSNGDTSIDFNDPLTYSILGLYKQRVVNYSSSSLSLVTVNSIPDGGWSTQSLMDWDTNSLLLPDDLYVLKGFRYTILPENLNTNAIEDLQIEANMGLSTEVSTNKEALPIQLNTEGTTLSDLAEVHSDDYRVAIKKNFNIHSVDPTKFDTKDINILVLGDENAIGIPYFIKNLILETSTLNPVMIGTMDNQLLNFDSTKGEARPGWRWTDFTGTTTGGAPLISSDVNKNNSNPFINPDTKVFDFSYYMTQQKFTKVDYVIIMSGYNDIMNKSIFGGDTDISTEDILTNTHNAIDTIETSIHKFNKDTKIAIVPPSFPGITSQYHTLIANYIKDYLDNLQSTDKYSILGNYLSTGIRNGKMGTPDVGLNVIFSSRKESLPMDYTDSPSSSRINAFWSTSWILNNIG